jgi:hypothetical protein
MKSRFVLKSHFVLLPVLALCSGIVQADIYRSIDPDKPTTFTNILPTEGNWVLYRKEKPVPVREEPAYDTRRFTVDSRTRFASHIQAAAVATNVDAALIRAVISVESGFNPSAVSRAGAVGLMQLMPETAKRYDVTDSHDPEQNIHGGAQYLHDLLRMFNYDLHLAIAAYNAGEQAVMKFGNRIPPYRETMAYVPKVLKAYRQYHIGHAPAAQSGNLRFSRAAPKNRNQSRVSRTYIANPAQLQARNQ